jgi:TRAP transporter 4TM/12TM fusion protein
MAEDKRSAAPGDAAATVAPAPTIDADRLKKAEQFVEQDEGATNRFTGVLGLIVTAGAVAMSLFHLYSAFYIVPAETLRAVHVAAALFLIFLLFPVARRFRHRLMPWDVLLALAAVAAILYLLLGGDDLRDRSSLPNRTDMIVGVVFILLILESVRRTSGAVMLAVVVLFILYGLYGHHLPDPWRHRGYDAARMVGHLYMSLEGIFGSAVDVSATLIILFTIYGAVLNATGAGKFFIDFSFSVMGGRKSGAGPTVVLSSFLLGGPSGSGVATTVTLGTVAYPMLAKAGYSKNAAGGLLAAGGLGAIISPPVLGAAAFLIAEYLKVSYLDVVVMATVPTCLYYFSILAMVVVDMRKYGMRDAEPAQRRKLLGLLRAAGHHFLSLILIIVFMLIGLTPMLAVVWATIVAALATLFPPLLGLAAGVALIAVEIALPANMLGALAKAFQPNLWTVVALVAVAAVGIFFFRQPHRITAPQLAASLREGSVGMLNVAATCAAAGIIVGVVTLTGLGQKFAGIIVDAAGGSLVLTAIYCGLVVWVIGLAVPVTASYIICAQIVAPALTKLGVPDFAAHMFIFYYAVLSEVSPPTALSPFAAAAITGGGPYATTLQAWKYTVPAFVVPFAFVLEPAGAGILLKLPKGAGWGDVALLIGQVTLGLAALAAAFQGWLRRRLHPLEIAGFTVAGLLLVSPKLSAGALSPFVTLPPGAYPLIGLGLVGALAVLQLVAFGRRSAER